MPPKTALLKTTSRKTKAPKTTLPKASPQKHTRTLSVDAIQLPPATDWRTTDQDEINRRILRAREEKFGIRNLTPCIPVFSDSLQNL